MLSCCEGDIKLFETGNGPDISIVNGEPAHDEGLENAVYLSLFSPAGWWGNAIAEPDEKHESRFEEIFRRNLTNAVRLDAERFAEAALAWMVAAGLAESVTATGRLLAADRLELTIEIIQPSGSITIPYQINWRTMAARVGVA